MGITPSQSITRIIILVFISVLFAGVFQVDAGQEIITLSTRRDLNNHDITLSYLLDTPDGKEVRSILLILSGGNGVIKLTRKEGGAIAHSSRQDLFFRLKGALQERAIALAVPDTPSDQSNGLSYRFRKDRDHWTDIERVAADVRKRYPGVGIFLTATGAGGVSALYSAKVLKENLSGIILAGMDSNELSDGDHSGVRIPVLVFHHLDDGCSASPFIEAKEISEKYSFTFVPLWGGRPSRNENLCLSLTSHGFLGLEDRIMDVTARWMAKEKIDVSLPDGGKVFLNEQVFWIPAGSDRQAVKLQTTVFKPDGPGPFPLAVINHGADLDKVKAGELRARLRVTAQSKILVDWGFVVALPMRRGYGHSGGAPNQSVSTYDYGLEDAKDVQAAVDFMCRQSYVDRDRVVLVGQSAGGLASLAYGSLGKENLKGIVNFAGGRKKKGVSRWEFMMAEAFGTYAKTTRVPSVWFYTDNDSFFPPDVARTAYDQYQKGGGQAKLHALPAFKKDGHGLFSDPAGIPWWKEEVRGFLKQIGFAIPEK